MAMMLSDTYEAFIAAGVRADKAKKASEEIAGFYRLVMVALILAGMISLVVRAFFL